MAPALVVSRIQHCLLGVALIGIFAIYVFSILVPTGSTHATGMRFFVDGTTACAQGMNRTTSSIELFPYSRTGK